MPLLRAQIACAAFLFIEAVLGGCGWLMENLATSKKIYPILDVLGKSMICICWNIRLVC